MIQVWELSKEIAGISYRLGMFTHKEDALRLQEGYKSMYNEELKLEERIVYDSISEIEV